MLSDLGRAWTSSSYFSRRGPSRNLRAIQTSQGDGITASTTEKREEMLRMIRYRNPSWEVRPWGPCPLPENKKRLMAMLMVYGATKELTMVTVSTVLRGLARAVGMKEKNYLAKVKEMLKEAEDTILLYSFQRK
jgi:hypothetical protein